MRRDLIVFFMPFRTGSAHVMTFWPIGGEEHVDQRPPHDVGPCPTSEDGIAGMEAGPRSGHVTHIISFQARCMPISAESAHGSISRTNEDNDCSIRGGLFVMANLTNTGRLKQLFEIKTAV